MKPRPCPIFPKDYSLGVGEASGDGVGLGEASGDGVGVGEASGDGIGLGEASGDGIGLGDTSGDGDGDGDGDRLRLGEGEGEGSCEAELEPSSSRIAAFSPRIPDSDAIATMAPRPIGASLLINFEVIFFPLVRKFKALVGLLKCSPLVHLMMQLRTTQRYFAFGSHIALSNKISLAIAVGVHSQ
jgi:hypothetical protein